MAPVRRVVTTTDSEGRSSLLSDGDAAAVLEQPGRGLVFHELWVTERPLASNEGTTDAGEVLLRPGDVLIQRATNHTWRNRGTETCVFASVMASAEPMPPPEGPER